MVNHYRAPTGASWGLWVMRFQAEAGGQPPALQPRKVPRVFRCPPKRGFAPRNAPRRGLLVPRPLAAYPMPDGR